MDGMTPQFKATIMFILGTVFTLWLLAGCAVKPVDDGRICLEWGERIVQDIKPVSGRGAFPTVTIIETRTEDYCREWIYPSQDQGAEDERGIGN